MHLTQALSAYVLWSSKMSLKMVCATGLRGLSKKVHTIPAMYYPTKNILHPRLCHLNLSKLLSSKMSSASSNNLEANSLQTGPREGFITIYRLPSAANVAKINLAKRLQTIMYLIAAPMSIAMAFANVLSSDTSLVFCVGGAILTFKLHLFGWCATDVVGGVYVSPDLSTVQISYLDQNGRRNEDVFPSSDLVPLSEVPSHFLEKYYFKLRRYSQPTPAQAYKLSLCYGNITDKDRFTKIFGIVDD